MTVQSFSHFVPTGTPLMFQSKAKKAPAAPVQTTPNDSVQFRHKRQVQFGSGEQDPNFKDLFKTTGKVLKSKYRKFKDFAKRELAKPDSENKAALVFGGTALAAEYALGGITGGALTAAALSAAGGYGGAKVAKSQIKKHQTPPPPPPRRDARSDSDEHIG